MPVIKIVVTNKTTGQVKPYQFTKNTVVFGRSSEGDVVLDGGGVSRRHMQLVLNGNLLEIEDFGSGNGTLVDSKRITSKERIPLKKGDQIRIEEFTIEFDVPNMVNLPKQKDDPAPEETEALSSASQKANFEITDPDILEIKMIKKILGAFDHDKRPGLFVVSTPYQNLKANIEDGEEFFIGRDPKCQLAIDSQTVSRKHAQISKKWGSFVVTDLGSKNGTFVNGDAIQEKIIQDGDEIVFGTIKTLFKNPEEFSIEAISKSMTDEQQAHDKIKVAAELEKAEQIKLAAEKSKPETAGPSEQAQLSLVPETGDKSKDDKKSTEQKPDAKALTKEEAKKDDKPAEVKKDPKENEKKNAKDKKDQKAADAKKVEPKKDDTGATKTAVAKKKSAGLFGQFSAMEFTLLGFGLVVLALLIGMLYWIL